MNVKDIPGYLVTGCASVRMLPGVPLIGLLIAEGLANRHALVQGYAIVISTRVVIPLVV